MILDKMAKNRTHRSFTRKEVKTDDLRSMIEGARVSATTRNSQKVRFFLINDEKTCDEVFKLIKFAGAIPWNPTLEESPRAYIAVCGDEDIKQYTTEDLFNFDMGLCTQNILLVAVELGYSGCILAAYNKPAFDKLVDLPKGYKSYYLIALGEAKDTVTIVDVKDGNTTYYRDDKNNHFVPKLPIDELIISK
jgi:nitroreductase